MHFESSHELHAGSASMKQPPVSRQILSRLRLGRPCVQGTLATAGGSLAQPGERAGVGPARDVCRGRWDG